MISRVGDVVGVLQIVIILFVFLNPFETSGTFFLLHDILLSTCTFHVVNNAENMHAILYIRSCQSKYIQIYSFRNEITKKSIFSAAHDSCSNN